MTSHLRGERHELLLKNEETKVFLILKMEPFRKSIDATGYMMFIDVISDSGACWEPRFK